MSSSESTLGRPKRAGTVLESEIWTDKNQLSGQKGAEPTLTGRRAAAG